jgi:hypothetical protein
MARLIFILLISIGLLGCMARQGEDYGVGPYSQPLPYYYYPWDELPEWR